MMKQSKLALLVLISTIATAQSKSFVEVHIPFDLHNRDGEEHVTAGYGFHQPYGSIASYVYLTDADLCSGWDTKNGTDGFPKHTGGMKRLRTCSWSSEVAYAPPSPKPGMRKLTGLPP